MNYMKSNKKGVKLLAAVMAFAMVLVAGFAIIGNADEADAETTPATEVDATLTGTASCVTGEKTTAFPASGVSAGTLVLKANSKITITTPSTVDAGQKVKVHVDGSSPGSYVTTNYVEITTKLNTQISVTIENKSGQMYVSTSNIEGVDCDITVGGSITNVAGSIKSSDQINGIKYGVLLRDDSETNDYTYYSAGTDLKSIILVDPNDEITLVNGSASVSKGNNIVKIDVTSANVAVKSGSSAIPTIEGTITTGEVKVTSGYFGKESSGVTSHISAVEIIDNTVGPTATLKGYTYNIRDYDASKAFTISGTLSYNIVGTVVQNTSFTPTSATPITVAADSTFAVASGVTLKVTTVGLSASTSTIKVLGLLDTTSPSIGTGKVLVGPAGLIKTSSGVVAATGTTNVDSGKDTTVTGNVTAIGTSVIGNDDMTVPEGITVTLNGDLGLNGNTLFVNGTLIIAEGSSIFGTGNTTELIVLGANGKIVNNGKMGAVYGVNIADVNDNNKYVKIQGVSGAEFAYKSNALTVSGDIQTVRNSAGTNVITINSVPINGEFTVGKKVTLNGSNVSASKNSVVTIDGILSTGVTINEGAQITINGVMNKNNSIYVVVGTYAYSDNSFTAGANVEVQNVNSSGDAVTGFTVYSKRIGTPAADDTVNYSLEAFISGTIADGDVTTDTVTPTISISGKMCIEEKNTLLVKEDAKLTVSNTIVLDGKVTIENNEGSGRAIAEANYLGAAYTVTGTETNAKQTGTTCI